MMGNAYAVNTDKNTQEIVGKIYEKMKDVLTRPRMSDKKRREILNQTLDAALLWNLGAAIEGKERGSGAASQFLERTLHSFTVYHDRIAGAEDDKGVKKNVARFELKLDSDNQYGVEVSKTE